MNLHPASKEEIPFEKAIAGKNDGEFSFTPLL